MDKENSPIFENFHYPRPKAFSPTEKLLRRLRQTVELFLSPRFKDSKDLKDQMTSYYSKPGEVDFYKAYSQFGFHENEMEAFAAVTKNKVEQKLKILVVGCGAGREAFSLAKGLPQSLILGIDLSPQMILAANDINKCSRVRFLNCDLDELNEQCDLIWVSSLIQCHIQGKKNRIHFYKQLKRLLVPHGSIVLTPEIRKLHWRGLPFWSSRLLKLRWTFSKSQWESGDVLLSHFGVHSKAREMIYLHFYPNHKAFEDELNSAGFHSLKKLPQESWIIENMGC